MLQLGDEVLLYSVVFVAVLLGTRSPLWTAALTASLYLFLALFRFPQVPTSRARQVLRPVRGLAGPGKVSLVAHRGGGHDAPENTMAAIREVRGRVEGLRGSCPLSASRSVCRHWLQGAHHRRRLTRLRP